MQIHLISHTHWDREWYLTYEQFRLRLVGLIDRLLDLMESRPDFAHFHLDGQTIVLEDYLELRPQNEARLRALIESGRILIGPWYDMPDEFLVSGEALVRNLALGHRVSQRFGKPMPVGYLPDLFGHVGQMPQILRQFGLDNAILWRGFGGPRAEYWWESPDGSRVLMMHLPPEGYCNATRVHLDPEAMLERATAAARREAGRSSVGEVLLMNGVDHVEPHPVIPELARQLEQALKAPVRHSTLPAYVDAVRSQVQRNGATSLDVIHGELRAGEDYANLLPGVFSARIYLKQANARVQTLLEKRAEPLAAFASMLTGEYPADELAYAWKTLLQNHPHDSICGCSVDAVHDENMTRFARAEQVGLAIAADAADAIARAAPAAPDGTLRLIAINTTGTLFNGVMDAVFDLPYESAEPRRVVDRQALDAPITFWPKTLVPAAVAAPDGAPCPFQVVSEEDVISYVMSRHETPWALRARRMRLAFGGAVAACGFAAFDVTMTARSVTPVSVSTLTVGDRTARNEHLDMSINDDGTVDVVDRKSGTRYARCGELEDGGDVGDEYNYSPPARDRLITSADAVDVTITRLAAGPARAAFQIDYALRLPASAHLDRSARAPESIRTPVRVIVSLDEGARRVDWQITIDNQSTDHRLRLLFPVGVEAIESVRAETAFGAVRRPARRAVPREVRVEAPASSGPTAWFTEAGSDTTGAIVFGDGLMEYEAYTGDRPARLALTLVRCVGYLSREDLVTRPSGHAGPGLATPGAQCLGTRQFRAAFEPRREPPANAELFAAAASFVCPPTVVPAVSTHPQLSTSGAFLTLLVRQGGVVLSACQRSARDGRVRVRVFNPDQQTATCRVEMHGAPAAISRVDFLDRPLVGEDGQNAAGELTVPGYGIATFLVEFPTT